LFVVLLVVLSLLTTAATVVYVNKESVQVKALDDTKAQLTAKEQQLATAQEQLTAAQQNATAVQQEANNQARTAAAALSQAQQQIADLNVQLAKASSQAAAQQLDISRMTEALNASQATAGRLQEEVARLRTGNDTLVKQATDLNSTVSDLTNKLEVTENARRNLAEQLSQASAEVQRQSQVIKGAGLAPQQQQQAVNRSAPAINGVIRDVRPIAGRQYATISVGSADGVTPGMQFKVLDRNTRDFLGTLTVDSVEPNESTGRLEGPSVAAIKPGVEVRTQL
jgi:chromosome segregation ATPase